MRTHYQCYFVLSIPILIKFIVVIGGGGGDSIMLVCRREKHMPKYETVLLIKWRVALFYDAEK